MIHCAVEVLDNKSRKITYEGEKGFSLDGNAGNIMVEIPKFYCKREIIDNYEYLWISPVKEEGFTVDPSFIASDGEIDHNMLELIYQVIEGFLLAYAVYPYL